MIEDKRIGEEAKVDHGFFSLGIWETELPLGYGVVYLDILWITGWEFISPDVMLH